MRSDERWDRRCALDSAAKAGKASPEQVIERAETFLAWLQKPMLDKAKADAQAEFKKKIEESMSAGNLFQLQKLQGIQPPPAPMVAASGQVVRVRRELEDPFTTDTYEARLVITPTEGWVALLKPDAYPQVAPGTKLGPESAETLRKELGAQEGESIVEAIRRIKSLANRNASLISDWERVDENLREILDAKPEYESDDDYHPEESTVDAAKRVMEKDKSLGRSLQTLNQAIADAYAILLGRPVPSNAIISMSTLMAEVRRSAESATRLVGQIQNQAEHISELREEMADAYAAIKGTPSQGQRGIGQGSLGRAVKELIESRDALARKVSEDCS